MYGGAKALEVFQDLGLYLIRPGSVAFFAFVLVLFRMGRRVSKAVVPLLLVALFELFWIDRTSKGGMGVSGFVLYFALLGPPLAFLLRGRSYVRPWFLHIWIPSAAMAFTMGWASTNNNVNTGIGFLPGAICTSFFLGMWLDEILEESYWNEVVFFLPSAFMAVIMIYFGKNAFHEGNITKLNARISHGPHGGMITSQAKKSYFREIQTDIKAASASAQKILIYPHFPAGYLATNRRTVSNSVWSSCMNTGDQNCLDYYRGVIGKGTLVVRIKRQMVDSGELGDAHAEEFPLDTWVRSTCHKRAERANYDLFDC